MIRLDLAAQHPLLPTAAQILLVYIASLGGVLAAKLAWEGRPAYWLSVLGVLFFLIGALWGRGILSSGTTFSAVGAGIAMMIVGVALDLLFGPPFSTTK
ncbi:MAG: hypothetical protein M3077_02485 [Candidatus Dormibacteraeota bacterium]|nr:hypothetical protein [Candidatus Dormibacteraeota bacterium]